MTRDPFAISLTMMLSSSAELVRTSVHLSECLLGLANCIKRASSQLSQLTMSTALVPGRWFIRPVYATQSVSRGFARYDACIPMTPVEVTMPHGKVPGMGGLSSRFCLQPGRSEAQTAVHVAKAAAVKLQ